MAASSKNVGAIERSHTIKDVPRCEEYEAMISGMPFRPWESATLERGQLRAKNLCHEYDETKETDPSQVGVHRADDVVLRTRMQILKSLLGDVQENTRIEIPFSVLYGCNTSIGHNFYANTGFVIDDSGFVTIGDDVTIGPQVYIITINHSTDVAQRLKGVMYTRPVTIGSACWIGARAMILPGATIGYGCTIGAGAVVSGNIPEYSVAVGVPARVVKRVFPTQPASTTAMDQPNVLDSGNPHDKEEDVKDHPLEV